MIIERKNGCDCPYGNFTCEMYGCVRKIRSNADLLRDSAAAKAEREASGEGPFEPDHA